MMLLQNLPTQSWSDEEIGELVAEIWSQKNVVRDKNFRMSFQDYVTSKEETHEANVPKIEKPKSIICVDNKAATQIVHQDGGSWRTRHLRVRAATVKEKIEREEIAVHHTPGGDQLADLNTKTHGSQRLEELKKMWGIIAVNKGTISED